MVKELVENSLDAGALEIIVEISGGGTESIRVVDNGDGIPSDEVELAVQRFATSKVAVAEDLDTISTLGFRGEALPSIASVSSVTMITRSPAQEFGTRIDVVEGKVVRKEPQGAAPGTVMTVRHLFKDFPARRKFLRTTATEVSRVQSVVSRYALAYPEVRFQLVVEGSTSLSSSGSGDLREAVASVYGREVAEAMLELAPVSQAVEGAGPLVWGMVSAPSLHRANRSYISFFVNRRWVLSPMLGKAVEQAYHGFLMERRHPLAAINLTVPYGELDVNMHPAKTEVRFGREGQVFSLVQQAVRSALTVHSPVPEISHRPGARPGVEGDTRTQRSPFWPGQPSSGTTAPTASEPHAWPVSSADAALTPKSALPVLRALGQVQNTYIVAEGPDGMYLIDQHAAHERVLFEKVQREAESRVPGVQTLLELATVELDARRQELVETQRELIEGVGFHVDAFGGRTYILRSVPELLREADPSQTFLEVLDLMAEGGGFESWEERAAYSIACHGAIRAGKSLTHEEMSELTRRLEECRQPHTCPHGRPTMIHLSSGRLDREFGRR